MTDKPTAWPRVSSCLLRGYDDVCEFRSALLSELQFWDSPPPRQNLTLPSNGNCAMPLGPRRQAVDGERKEKLSSEELIRDLAAEAKQPPHAGEETEALVPAAAEKLAIPVFAEPVTRSLFPHLHPPKPPAPSNPAPAPPSSSILVLWRSPREWGLRRRHLRKRLHPWQVCS